MAVWINCPPTGVKLVTLSNASVVSVDNNVKSLESVITKMATPLATVDNLRKSLV